MKDKTVPTCKIFLWKKKKKKNKNAPYRKRWMFFSLFVRTVIEVDNYNIPTYNNAADLIEVAGLPMAEESGEGQRGKGKNQAKP